jgi:signal transduction histidine kinase
LRAEGQAGEIDVLVGLIAGIEDPESAVPLTDRICEAVCRSTSLTRAAMFLHDSTLGVSRPVGSHGVDQELIASVSATLDEMPVAQRVLVEDRVIEVSQNLEFELPARYAGLAGITTITCAPVAAGGEWLGVIVGDQGGQDYSLPEEDHQRIHTLGRLAAVAATVERSTLAREQARSLDNRIEMIREIHDQVVQKLFGLSLALGADEPLSAEERRRCSEEISAVLGQLRSALGRSVTPRERPQSRSFRELADWFSQSPDVSLDWEDGLETPGHLDLLSKSALTEGMRNANRHSDGGRVQIRVAGEAGTFSVEVMNDRVATERRRGGGLGLRLLTLEALEHDALVEFGPLEGGRWRFRLVAPVTA